MVETVRDLRALNVLIMEEREDDARQVLRELVKSGYAVNWKRVCSRADFLQAIDQETYDLIFSVYSLQDFSAGEALLITHKRNLDIPFIVVTDSFAEDRVVALMQQGASDYIIKDRLARLGGAVSAALEQKRLRVEKDQALMRLSDSEERFRRIAENVPDVLYRLRTYPDLAYEFFSPAVEQILGYPPEAFYPDYQFIFEIVHPDDRETLREQFALPLVSTDTYVLRWIHRDGRVVWTEQRNMRVFDEEHRLIAVEGIARDITERVEREREQEAILTVVSALRDAMTRAEIVPVVVEKVARLLNADQIALCVVDPANGGLRVEAAAGKWSAWIGRHLEVNHETLRQMISEGRPLMHDAGQSCDEAGSGWLANIQLLICAPMISQEETVGVLCVGCSGAAPRPEQQESIRKLTKLIADITASALHRASLYEETRQRVQRLTSLRNIDRALSAGLERGVIVSILLDQLMQQHGVDLVDLLLMDPYTQTLRYEQGRGFQANPGTGFTLRLNESLAGQVVLTRRYRSEADLGALSEGGMQRGIFLAEGMRAYLAVPLMAHGEVLGVLELLRRDSEPFDPDWLEYVESLVGQVSTALNNAELYERIQRTNFDLVQAYDAVIQAWAQALESRGIEPRGHTRRTMRWTLALARAFGVSDEQLAHIRRGVLLHDIGTMSLTDQILLKPGPLTDDEMAQVRRHPHTAHVWLSPIPYLHQALEIPYCHHEAWDGSGYPRGLRGTQIPLPARIFRVADVWDVLRSDRPHRPAWTREQAMAYIHEQAGTQFDPNVVAMFLQMVEAGGAEEEEI